MEPVEVASLRWKKFPVLDDGFVALVDAMGNDQSVVQAARVSYGRGLFRTSPHSDRLVYKRGGRVLLVAVMRKSLFRQSKRLGRDFRLALG